MLILYIRCLLHSQEAFSFVEGRTLDLKQLAFVSRCKDFLTNFSCNTIEMIIACDLQGQFSFVVFDSNKRRLFAARDASGTEPLYINTEEDGAMAFTNSPTSNLADKCETWQEVGQNLILPYLFGL